MKTEQTTFNQESPILIDKTKNRKERRKNEHDPFFFFKLKQHGFSSKHWETVQLPAHNEGGWRSVGRGLEVLYSNPQPIGDQWNCNSAPNLDNRGVPLHLLNACLRPVATQALSQLPLPVLIHNSPLLQPVSNCWKVSVHITPQEQTPYPNTGPILNTHIHTHTLSQTLCSPVLSQIIQGLILQKPSASYTAEMLK